eukprot:6523785-Pyramimonas_sp.AAC.1
MSSHTRKGIHLDPSVPSCCYPCMPQKDGQRPRGLNRLELWPILADEEHHTIARGGGRGTDVRPCAGAVFIDRLLDVIACFRRTRAVPWIFD